MTDAAPQSRQPEHRPRTAERTARSGVVPLVAGVIAVVVVFGLGAVARSATVIHHELAFDRMIAAGRTGPLTDLAHLLTASATPEVTGIGAAILLPLLLFLLRRRSDALRALCVLGGALVLALVAKDLIDERRPPAALWAIPADSGTSYPSGHTTVAAAIVVALIVVTTTRARRTAVVIIGGCYAVAVAVSRVYVANHYPLDVVGSLLCAAAAGLIVAGLSTLPPSRRLLNMLDRQTAHRLDPEPAPADLVDDREADS